MEVGFVVAGKNEGCSVEQGEADMPGPGSHLPYARLHQVNFRLGILEYNVHFRHQACCPVSICALTSAFEAFAASPKSGGHRRGIV